MTIENPTIVIPGIKGSSLENFYSIEPNATWSEVDAARTLLLGPDLDDLALDPSATFDASARVVTRPNGLLPIAYAPLVKALRKKRALPVYVFPYDWRYSVFAAGERLKEFVALVRKKNEKANGWSGKIDFVCHSMGGLVFRSFLGERTPVQNKVDVGRVVFLAVPHRGSLDAVEAMIRGETSLFAGRKEMRKLARTFPGVYELLPRFEKALVDDGGNELSAFDIDHWQQNVTPHGPDKAEKNGFDVEKEHLLEADAVLSNLKDPLAAGLSATEVLTVYGVKKRSTLERVVVGPPPERRYDFKAKDKGDGDGIVPACSALLAGIPAIKLTEEDVSYWTETTAALNMHAFIGSLDETQTIVSRFLAGWNSAKDLLPRGMDAAQYEASPTVAP